MASQNEQSNEFSLKGKFITFPEFKCSALRIVNNAFDFVN